MLNMWTRGSRITDETSLINFGPILSKPGDLELLSLIIMFISSVLSVGVTVRVDF